MSCSWEVQHHVVSLEGIDVVMVVAMYDLLRHQIHTDKIVGGGLESHKVVLPAHPHWSHSSLAKSRGPISIPANGTVSECRCKF
jgi:hypothetical protein